MYHLANGVQRQVLFCQLALLRPSEQVFVVYDPSDEVVLRGHYEPRYRRLEATLPPGVCGVIAKRYEIVIGGTVLARGSLPYNRYIHPGDLLAVGL